MLFNLNKYFNKKNIVTQFFIFLSMFAALATIDHIITQTSFVNVVIRHGLILAVADVTTLYIFREKLGAIQLNPLNFFITCLILFLVVDPQTHVMLLPLVVLMAMLGKHVRYENQPVFNPAACGGR